MNGVTQWMGCQVCGEALNHWTEPGSLGVYQHPPRLGMGMVRDHEPVPIPLEQVKKKFHMCDFCGSEDAICMFSSAGDAQLRYNYVGKTGEVDDKTLTKSWRDKGEKTLVRQETGVVTGGLDATTSGEWTACESCARVVERGDMGRVISHVKAIYAADPARRHRNPSRAALEELYREFFRTINTQRIPL